MSDEDLTIFHDVDGAQSPCRRDVIPSLRLDPESRRGTSFAEDFNRVHRTLVAGRSLTVA